jgi:hypothetical protein
MAPPYSAPFRRITSAALGSRELCVGGVAYRCNRCIRCTSSIARGIGDLATGDFAMTAGWGHAGQGGTCVDVYLNERAFWYSHCRGNRCTSASEENHMAKKTDIDDIISSNPMVDARQLHEAQSLLRELRECGLARPEYNLSMPYQDGLRRLQASDESTERCLLRRGRTA